MPAATALTAALADVRKRIARASKGLNEQNTKATLIEPALRALGWDTEDVEEVVREFRVKPRDKPVDYGLLVLREAKLFVEAKPFGENLDDRRWANQIMGYASVAGVEWIVLTNGDEWRIYNTHATVPVEEKLFRSVSVSDETPFVAETLELLAKDELDAHKIEALWKAHFVDRHVKAALENLFEGENDMVLVNHVMGRARNLSADDVRASLRRCKIALDFPVLSVADLTTAKAPTPKVPTREAGAVATIGVQGKASYGVGLRDLIEAGFLRAPLALTAPYRGTTLSARLEKNGTVAFGGESYTSLSQAGGAARASVIGLRKGGKLPATGGWTFWRYRAPDGTEQEIDHARQAYLHANPRAPSAAAE